jgi:hypothetical protein
MDKMREFEEQFIPVGMEHLEEETEQIPQEEYDEVPNQYEELEQEGPTMQDVQLWKKQYPYSSIFQIVHMSQLYILRSLNRVEYKSIVAREDLNAITREEVIFKTCCLYPQISSQYMGEGGAGTPAIMAEFIMRISGFIEPEEVKQLA